jgi:hypothetical protein
MTSKDIWCPYGRAGSKQILFSKKDLDSKNLYLNHDIGSCKSGSWENPALGVMVI